MGCCGREAISWFLLCILIHSCSMESQPLVMNIVSYNIVACNSNCQSHLCTSRIKALDQSTTGMIETIGRYAIFRKPGTMLALCYKTEIVHGKVEHHWEISTFKAFLNTESRKNFSKMQITQLTSKLPVSAASVKPSVTMNYNQDSAQLTITCSTKFLRSESQTLLLLRVLPDGRNKLVGLRADHLEGSLTEHNQYVTLTFTHKFLYTPEYYRNKFKCLAKDQYSSSQNSALTDEIAYEREIAKHLSIRVNHEEKIFTKSATLQAYDDFVNGVTLTCQESIGSPRPQVYWIDSTGKVTNSSQVDLLFSDYKEFCCYATQVLHAKALTTRQCVDIKFKPRECNDIKTQNPQSKSGLYTIYVKFRHEDQKVKVYCDMETDNKGWIVIQKRFDGRVPFNKYWSEYREGFGDLNGEFWLGNLNIHYLTHYRPTIVRFDLWSGNKYAYAEFETFAIAGEEDYYRLAIGGYSGNASDSILHFNLHNQRFSTRDIDNDAYYSSCSKSYGYAGWWFNNCQYQSNLNGKYLPPGRSDSTGIIWYQFERDKSLNRTEIKIKYKDY